MIIIITITIRKKYPTGESVYTFLLSDEDFTQRRDTLYLDASNVASSNLTRYINHDPVNVNIEYIISRKKIDKRRITANVRFYAIKDIYKDDELLFNYGPRYEIDYGPRYEIEELQQKESI